MGRRRSRGWVGSLMTAAALAGLFAPAAQADSRVESGSLRARVGGDPWRLLFTDAGGDPVLAESGERGSGPIGALGFRTSAGWSRATRVLSTRREGGALAATVATTDAARRLAVRIEPDREGVIRLTASVEGSGALPVTATGIGFRAQGSERYLGFGERSNAVDQRGGEVENYVSDGPYQREERPFIATFVPPWGVRFRDDATYFPMPWLLSSAGYGVLVQNSETSRHRLGESDAWSLEVDAPRLELRVFAGPRPADVLRRLTRHTGRQPPPAARWFHGPWFQPVGREPAQLEMVRRLRRGDVPASAVNTFLHYLPCGDQEGRRPGERVRTAALKREGVAVTTYFNPMVCADYPQAFEPARRAGALTKNELGQPYLYRYSASTDDLFLAGQYDFSHPDGPRLFGDRLREAVEDGYDGWMEDFGEYTPPDSRSADGSTGAQMHNLYPVLYHRASYEFARRQGRGTAGYIRSGWTGVHPYAQLVWGGDPTTSFGFDGLESAVRQGLTLGLSGISRWGSDIGGFFALGQNELTPELLRRWIEFGAVSGIMRTEANGVAVPPRDRPQIDDPEILPTWRRYAKLRTQLYPYLSAADAHYRRTGMPLMRHGTLSHPGDPAAARDDQFMFGGDLLAAPVIRDGQRTRSLYLPRGRWVDLWRTAGYDARGGGLGLARARPLEGSREVSVPAPLDQLPLFVRAGALLPLLPADVDTVSDYGRGGGAVRLADRRNRFELLAFPRGFSTARVGDGGGRLRSRERRGRWDLRISGPRGSRYRVRAALTTLRRPFRPRAVCSRGRRPLSRRLWRYDARNRVLRVNIRTRARTTVLVASRSRAGCRRR